MNLRRSRNDTDTPVPDEGAVVTAPTTTPRSQESVNRVLAALRDSDSQAKDRDEKARKAIADAERLDQAIAGLNQRENELRAELDQIQRDRDAATKHAMDARAWANRMGEERDEFRNQAADSADVLAGWGVTLDPDLLVPTNGSADIDGSLARIDAAHAELPAKYRDDL